MDGEGRALITDHGGLVVVNAYVPCASPDAPDPARFLLKLDFLAALVARAAALAAAGRAVAVAGDFNLTLGPLDAAGGGGGGDPPPRPDLPGHEHQRQQCATGIHREGASA